MIHEPNACNHCRSTSTFCIGPTPAGFYVWCPVCGAEGPHRASEEAANTAWAEANPLKVHTEWVFGPAPQDGLMHIQLAHIIEDQLYLYEAQLVKGPNGVLMICLVRTWQPKNSPLPNA